MASNETTNAFFNESSISPSTYNSSILFSTISEYDDDEILGDNLDYDDLYGEHTTTLSNTTLSSVDEPLTFDWSLFYTARFIIALVLAGISLVINLIIIVKVVVHPNLQKSGYFHLHIFFLAINTIYLILTCPYRAFMAQSFLFHYMGWTAPVSYFIASNQWILKAMIDTPHCLLGLQAWLLCCMTIECRMSMSWSFHSRKCFITATRITCVILSLIIFIASVAFISVLRNENTVLRMKSNHLQVRIENQLTPEMETDDYFRVEDVYKVVIIYTIFILVLTVLPIFMIVLIGVSNCISFTASSRKWDLSQRLAITIDRRYNIASIVLLAFMLVHFTQKMSEEVDASNQELENEEFSDASLLVSDIIHLSVDVLLIIFSVITGGTLLCCPGIKRMCQDTPTNKMI